MTLCFILYCILLSVLDCKNEGLFTLYELFCFGVFLPKSEHESLKRFFEKQNQVE